ncbi:MAG: class I SAM-dependent methyltransferase [Burkholderiales bacterium]
MERDAMSHAPRHSEVMQPSAWILRWAHLIPSGGRVLDLATGSGRNARHLAGLGYDVEAVDRDAETLALLRGISNINARLADLEQGDWPYASEEFGGIVVTNYLYRPLFPALLAALAHSGMLIYETFSLGNENFGKPSNPDFLLRTGELLEVVRGKLRVIAYEDVFEGGPRPAMMQRICAVRPAADPVDERR